MKAVRQRKKKKFEAVPPVAVLKKIVCNLMGSQNTTAPTDWPALFDLWHHVFGAGERVTQRPFRGRWSRVTSHFVVENSKKKKVRGERERRRATPAGCPADCAHSQSWELGEKSPTSRRQSRTHHGGGKFFFLAPALLAATLHRPDLQHFGRLLSTFSLLCCAVFELKVPC